MQRTDDITLRFLGQNLGECVSLRDNYISENTLKNNVCIRQAFIQAYILGLYFAYILCVTTCLQIIKDFYYSILEFTKI